MDEMAVLKYHISHIKIEKEYKITSTILGSGSYAIVKLGENIKNPAEKVAIKIYEKSKLFTNKQRRMNLLHEITVLKSLDHQNIIKLIKVFEDRAKIYLILDYVKGMSLFKYIKMKKTHGLGQEESRFILKEILGTLLYLHQKGITHRDVKLENILVTNDQLDPTNIDLPVKNIKVIDFGFALKYVKSERSRIF